MTKTNNYPIEKGVYLLKLAQHRKGSEIQAGARATLNPSPATNALSSFNGRMMARMINNLMGYPMAAKNFTAARIPILVHLMAESTPVDQPHPLFVDPVAGFSTLGYELALRFPLGEYIDIHTHETITELRRRLGDIQGLSLPENYHLIPVDHHTTTITGALENRHPDVLLTNGAYFSSEDNVVMLDYFLRLMQPGGTVICPFPLQPALEVMPKSMQFFMSQVGHIPGIIKHESDAIDIMGNAGYTDIQIYRASDLASTLNLPQPILDIEVFAVGRVL